jgi:hypothetical protein
MGNVWVLGCNRLATRKATLDRRGESCGSFLTIGPGRVRVFRGAVRDVNERGLSRCLSPQCRASPSPFARPTGRYLFFTLSVSVASKPMPNVLSTPRT